MNIWFTSDMHFGHGNIIKYCNRPFSSTEEMNKVLIRNWNERVDNDDTVFHLGDFCFGKSSEAPESQGFAYYRNQLKGNIIFIQGNHDKNNRNPSKIESMVISYGGTRIYMTHNPKFAKPEFRFNYVGHVHDKFKFKRLEQKSIIVNVGVDQWDFRPISINEIMAGFARWDRENGYGNKK